MTSATRIALGASLAAAASGATASASCREMPPWVAAIVLASCAADVAAMVVCAVAMWRWRR